MNKETQDSDALAKTEETKPKKGGERPLTTDERASFVILSLYMALFCICTFLYWDSLVLKILGVTTAAGGLFLFVAAFFNTEAPEKSHSIHPIRSYLFSLFIVLLVLFVIRFVVGIIGNTVLSLIVGGGGLLVALVVFRKAMVQVATTLLAIVFLFVMVGHRYDLLSGDMKFQDTVRQCGQVIFQIGPIQDVANLLVFGSYMGYLSHIDYHDEQLNILAIRTVAGTHDDAVKKTEAILDFVSNEIYYVSDPGDGVEYAKDPIATLIAGGGDCEDQTLLLCSMLESVGVKTYIAFTDEHVFALVGFNGEDRIQGADPHVYIDGRPCYALDAADPGAWIGRCASTPSEIKRIFDVRGRFSVGFVITP